MRRNSDSPYKCSEACIKSMLGFLVDTIYVVFGDQAFQQSVGIPIWALIVLPYWQTYFYIHMRQNLFQKLLRDNNKK
jgi:hypothetical protein